MRFFRPLLVAALAATVVGCGMTPQGLAPRTGSLNASVHEAGSLKLYVLPEAGDSVVTGAIAAARKVVRLQMYLLTHTGVMDALIAAKKRGVDVQVLLEARPYNPGNPNQPLPTNKSAAAYLAKGGVVANWTSESYRFTHAKALIIDDKVTYVSTANFTKSGLGAGSNSAREYIVADSSPSDVAAFVAMFEADWNHQPHVPTDEDLVVSPSNARGRIFELVKGAKRDVMIAVEVAADPAFTELLTSLRSRGVRVRALLGDHQKIGTNLETGKAWVAAGVDVRYQARPFLHAKSIVVDGQAMYLGSTNLTTNSMDSNREVGLHIATASIVKGVLATCEKDWARATPFKDREKQGKKPKFKDYEL